MVVPEEKEEDAEEVADTEVEFAVEVAIDVTKIEFLVEEDVEVDGLIHVRTRALLARTISPNLLKIKVADAKDLKLPLKGTAKSTTK